MPTGTKKQLITFALCLLCLLGCRVKDAVVPVGASTFLSLQDLKTQLGIDLVPQSLAFDRTGTLYAATYDQIIKITPDGRVSLVAGGLPGYKNGRIPDVLFHGIQGLAFDQQGNLYVGEQHNNCIRKITPDGRVSLFAGKPNWALLPGNEGPADGPDSSAHIAFPTALAVDAAGNLLETESGFISRYAADALRRISPAGYVKTVAGDAGEISAGVFVDQPAYFQRPSGLALGRGDTLFVSDSYNALIRGVLPTGRVVTVAGTGKRSAVNGPRRQAAFMGPTALAYSAAGLYIADGRQIRLLSPAGQVSTVTGTTEFGARDGSLAEARFGGILGMCFDAAGVLYVADDGSGIRRIRFK